MAEYSTDSATIRERQRLILFSVSVVAAHVQGFNITSMPRRSTAGNSFEDCCCIFYGDTAQFSSIGSHSAIFHC